MDKKVIKDFFKGNYETFYGKYLQLSKPSGSNNYSARCPFPGHKNEDKKPSFTFNTENGTYLCHGCGKKGHAFHFYAKLHGLDTKNDFGKILKNVANDFGIPWEEPERKLVKIYDYLNAQGELHSQTLKYNPKDYKQRRPNGNGGWIWKDVFKNVNPILYHLPDVIKSSEVILVEGEQDADAVASLGFCATTCPMGAKKWKKWEDTYNEILKGKNVVLIPDNDIQGREHMMQVGASLNDIVASLKWLELPDVPSKGGDFSDWLLKFPDKETAAERFSILLEQAEPYEAPQKKTYHDALIDVNDFLKLEIPPRIVVVDPWLMERTISLIYGWRGVGKSMFGLGLVDAICQGIPFGPWEVKNPLPCAYVDAEMPKEEAQQRLKLMRDKGYPEGMFWFYSNALAADMGLPGAHLMNDKFRRFLVAALKAKDIKFLFLDNLASLTRGIDENAKKDWDPVNEWLLDLRFMGVGTQMFHHESKEGKQRGHSGKEDHIDIAIRLMRPSNYVSEDGCKFIVKFDKSRSLSTQQLPLVADTLFQCTEDEQGEFVWTWGNAKHRTKIEIIKLLDKGQTQSEVAEELKVNKSYVSRMRKQAINDGYLSEQNKLSQSGFNFVGSQED